MGTRRLISEVDYPIYTIDVWEPQRAGGTDTQFNSKIQPSSNDFRADRRQGLFSARHEGSRSPPAGAPTSTRDLSANLEGEMGVVRANIQTVEDIYQLIWPAIASKRPIEAVYKGLPRLFCPHRLGRNRGGELRVLCYQYGGESESGLEAPGSPANWRCTALEKFSRVKLREDAWRTAPNHSRPASCVIEADIDAEDQPVELAPQKGQ